MNSQQQNLLIYSKKCWRRTEYIKSYIRAIEALTQIKLKKYTAIFEQHGVKSALAIGLAFFGKHVAMSYENIEIEK